MKLSTKSWHYRLYEFYYDSYAPNNLCTYFWKLVWAILVYATGGVFFLTSAGIVLYQMFIIPFLSVNDRTLCVTLWMLAIVITTTVLVSNYLKNRKRVYKEDKPTIVGEYWKAFKGKYCPSIQWEEKD